MENLTGSKYLHKKFKKPTNSITYTSTPNVEVSARNASLNTTSEQNFCTNESSVDPNVVHKQYFNINSVSSTNSSTSISLSVNQDKINDQVASISTSVESVPSTSSTLTTKLQSSDTDHNILRNKNNIILDRDQSETNFFLQPRTNTISILDVDLQNRNVNIQTKFIQENKSSQNISAGESDKNDINLRASNWELSSANSRSLGNSNSNTFSIAQPGTTNISTPSLSIVTTADATNTETIDSAKAVSVEKINNDGDPEKKVSNAEPNQGGKYVCSYCNLSCSKPSVLQKHIRAHTNERPYPCLSCGFSFKTRSNLYKHCRSRSHANRAKDTSEVPLNQSTNSVNSIKANETVQSVQQNQTVTVNETKTATDEKLQDNVPKVKPYKPKFHKLFLLEQNSENDNNENKQEVEKKNDKTDTSQTKVFSSELVKQNPDLLKKHITDLIHKNQTILDVKEPNFLKKRFLYHADSDENHHKTHGKSLYESNFHIVHEEPLNLTARNRKRCMSETEHTQKSLIKELLLKNLTQEQSYVCQFCKISFKNIENFEIHRKNYCKVGENPTSKDIAFVRSHSVNVASVLTQKYSRNNESPSKFVRTTLPLKSPGPFLGKTSLIGDKPNQVFYENRNPTRIHHPALSLSSDNFRKLYEKNDMYSPIKNNENGITQHKPLKNEIYNSAININNLTIPKPLNVLENDTKKRSYDNFQYTSNLKKPQTPIKLFGGEVKITETSGETRSFKIDSKNDYSPNSPQYVYVNKISENMVVKSSLQSGGTILQNTPTYDTKMSPFTPKVDGSGAQIFQFYDPKISNTNARKPYESENVKVEPTRFMFSDGNADIYNQRFLDFNQKAAKMFAPNIKQPNLTIPGLPIPNKAFEVPMKRYSDNYEQQLSPNWASINSPLFDNSKYSMNLKFHPDAKFKSDSQATLPKIDRISPTTNDNPTKITANTPSPAMASHIVLTQPDTDRNSTNLIAPSLRLYDPLNILINGKLVRYVPGMPGPESGNPIQVGFATDSPIASTQLSPKLARPPQIALTKTPLSINLYPPNDHPQNLTEDTVNMSNVIKTVHRTSPSNLKFRNSEQSSRLSPNVLKTTNDHLCIPRNKSPVLFDKRNADSPNKIMETQRKSLKNVRIISEHSPKSVKNDESSNNSELRIKSPLKITEVSFRDSSVELLKPMTSTSENTNELSQKSNKFLRPNSLAIKPYISMKNHHGLTPTIFNQALISPDTPRVAKKNCKLYLNGNCLFSCLGLKSSTKPTYCTLNKTQPFYVQGFGTLSMYSEWRHLECKINYVRMDTYDSRQRRKTYTVAQAKISDLMVDSSYKSVMVEASQKKEDSSNRSSVLPGGYESNEEYTYIRGRGRGRYVCDQCGIRCKKPSMLKKHIRTHSDVRPYTCRHCNFSFKTKGNLTKHMKSKAHYKRTSGAPCSESNGDNPSQCSTPSDEDSDSDMDNENDSDDSTRLQDHEAAHCLLSLSQNRSPITTTTNSESTSDGTDVSTETNTNHSLSDHETTLEHSGSIRKSNKDIHSDDISGQRQLLSSPNVFNGVTTKQPLTYPYYKVQVKQQNEIEPKADILKTDMCSIYNNVILGAKNIEVITQNLENFKNSRDVFSPTVATPTKINFIGDKLPNADLTIANFQQKFVKYEQERQNKIDLDLKRLNPIDYHLHANSTSELNRKRSIPPEKSENIDGNTEPKRKIVTSEIEQPRIQTNNIRKRHISMDLSQMYSPSSNSLRKRKLSYPEGHESELKTMGPSYENILSNNTKPYSDHSRGMDLTFSREYVENRIASARNDHPAALDLSTVTSKREVPVNLPLPNIYQQKSKIFQKHFDVTPVSNVNENKKLVNTELTQDVKLCIKRRVLNYKTDNLDEPNARKEQADPVIMTNEIPEQLTDIGQNSNDNTIEGGSNNSEKQSENDISAMQTLAEIAMKRVTVENTKLAQSVATEYLKLATKNDVPTGVTEPAISSCNGSTETAISELITKSEENKSCTICAKNFSKPSQLRLHMNIHYIERPFRCESCSVSFRSKGHLQKHERSASHHNKLSSSPTTSSSEPRPFKCSDCNIAFRIHGHLAKHLRSKMHIMRLECLARVPFGLYAELERANSLLTEINTIDCDMCLESLKILARKLFSNDPNKLVQIENPSTISSNLQEQQITVGSP